MTNKAACGRADATLRLLQVASGIFIFILCGCPAPFGSVWGINLFSTSIRSALRFWILNLQDRRLLLLLAAWTAHRHHHHHYPSLREARTGLRLFLFGVFAKIFHNCAKLCCFNFSFCFFFLLFLNIWPFKRRKKRRERVTFLETSTWAGTQLNLNYMFALSSRQARWRPVAIITCNSTLIIHTGSNNKCAYSATANDIRAYCVYATWDRQTLGERSRQLIAEAADINRSCH